MFVTSFAFRIYIPEDSPRDDEQVINPGTLKDICKHIESGAASEKTVQLLAELGKLMRRKEKLQTEQKDKLKAQVKERQKSDSGDREPRRSRSKRSAGSSSSVDSGRASSSASSAVRRHSNEYETSGAQYPCYGAYNQYGAYGTNWPAEGYQGSSSYYPPAVGTGTAPPAQGHMPGAPAQQYQPPTAGNWSAPNYGYSSYGGEAAQQESHSRQSHTTQWPSSTYPNPSSSYPPGESLFASAPKGVPPPQIPLPPTQGSSDSTVFESITYTSTTHHVSRKTHQASVSEKYPDLQMGPSGSSSAGDDVTERSLEHASKSMIEYQEGVKSSTNQTQQYQHTIPMLPKDNRASAQNSGNQLDLSSTELSPNQKKLLTEWQMLPRDGRSESKTATQSSCEQEELPRSIDLTPNQRNLLSEWNMISDATCKKLDLETPPDRTEETRKSKHESGTGSVSDKPETEKHVTTTEEVGLFWNALSKIFTP